MAEQPKQDVAPQQPKVEVPKEMPKQNPVFRAMGLPNFRWRLPSRNWMIFWTITGSFTAAILYDRREKKAVQKKWCDLVAHIAQQPLPTNQMPRKITVFLSAAPGDTIGPSRKYFKEYIKPILVAAAMDYDVIEGRKEGDVRYGTAEQIRRYRRKQGETSATPVEQEMDAATAIEMSRDARGIRPEPCTRGDLVLGRHTWKEYIRGIHEGWLGPLDEPVPEIDAGILPIPTTSTTEPPVADPSTAEPLAEAPTGIVHESEPQETEKKPEEQPEKKKPSPPLAYLDISSYRSTPPSQNIPASLDPSVPIHQQHLLGFLKTPQRIYNFLNRRKLADDLGRETAAIVLATSRPYEGQEHFVSSTTANPESPSLSTRAPENDADVIQTGSSYEQQTMLEGEEYYWHKSVRKPRVPEDLTEPVWLSDVVLDPRIAQRMRKFIVTSDEEERANRIAAGVEKSRYIEPEDLTKKEIVLGDVNDS